VGNSCLEVEFSATLDVSIPSSRKLYDRFNDATGNTGNIATIEKTIKEVAQSGLNATQEVKRVTVLSMNLSETLHNVEYDLVLVEQSVSSCEEQIDSTTLYNDVTSHVTGEILNGGFTSTLQANAAQCGVDCIELQNAVVTGGLFGNETLICLSEPSSQPTPKPSSQPTPMPSKRGKGRKNGKSSPEPTKGPSPKPTPKPTKRAKGKKSGKARRFGPTNAPTPKPTRRAKGNKRKKVKIRNKLCRGRWCVRKRVREHHRSDATSVHADELTLPDKQWRADYQPLRKRTPQRMGNRWAEISGVAQGEKDGERTSTPHVSYHGFQSDGPTHSPTFLGKQRTFTRKRIRENSSDIILSAKLLSAGDQQQMGYEPTRKRFPKAEEVQFNIYKLDQTKEDGHEMPVKRVPSNSGSRNSPAHHPTSYRKRVRDHRSDATPYATELLSEVGQESTLYQPYESKLPVKRASPTASYQDNPAYNPTLHRKRVRERISDATPHFSTHLLPEADQESTKYQPMRKRGPQTVRHQIELQTKEDEERSRAIRFPTRDYPPPGIIESPTFYPTPRQDKSKHTNKR